jgi:hypothetical protein
MEANGTGQPGEHNAVEKKKGSRPKVLSGLIVLVVGISFLLATMEVIDWDMWFPYFMILLGSAFIVDILISLGTTDTCGGITGRLIAGVVLLVIGVANLLDMEQWWPVIIVAVGAILLFNGLRARGRG